MSTQRKRGIVEDTLDDETVAEWLREHPEFFETNPDLVAALRVPHAAGGAISLVERQLSILRQQSRQLERKLVDLVEVARANDQLVERMHRLTVALFDAADLEGVVQAMFEQLRDGFGADLCTMVSFDARMPESVRTIARNDPELQCFSGFLEAGRPILGKLKVDQLAFLFGDQASQIASAVLVPVGERAEAGFLGIGSRRAEQFNPTMGTVYLARMGLLIALALRHRTG